MGLLSISFAFMLIRGEIRGPIEAPNAPTVGRAFRWLIRGEIRGPIEARAARPGVRSSKPLIRGEIRGPIEAWRCSSHRSDSER